MASFALKNVLKTNGWTQYRLAKTLDVSVSEVYRWCQKDANPTLKTLNRVSQTLGIPISELLEENNHNGQS